nr:hypothetical protein [uncultured Flavobacterium sp.]
MKNSKFIRNVADSQDSIIFKQIFKRLKAKTPRFWNKIRVFMVSCAGLGSSLMLIPKEEISFLPENTSGYLLTIGAVGTFLSSLAVQSPKDIN